MVILKEAFILLLVYGAVQAYLLDSHLADQCTLDSECVDGCCHQDIRHGRQCHKFSNQSQPCHLPNSNHTSLYPCGCQPGLTCTAIHLGSGPDPLHQAELLLLQHGYGWCQ